LGFIESTGRVLLKKWCLVSLVWVCGVVGAQTSSTKSDLVAKVLTLQQTAIEQTAQALVERPALQMMQQAGSALQTQVAPEKREAVAKEIQADLKKYVDEVGPLVRQKAVKLAPSTVGALLDQRFSEDELKQLIAIIESPVNRKFLQMGGELQKALADKLIAETQASVEPKVKALEQAMVKHLGLPATPAAKAEPASKAAKK
jgi:hypothetical protein